MYIYYISYINCNIYISIFNTEILQSAMFMQNISNSISYTIRFTILHIIYQMPQYSTNSYNFALQNSAPYQYIYIDG